VTTIAGDFSKSPGRVDGPGRNATFSPDYELSFVPEICALLEVFKLLNSKSWTTYLMNLAKQAQTCCFGTRNAAVSPALRFLNQLIMLFISHLSLMFSFRPNRVHSSSSNASKEYVSLLDSENSSNSECIMSNKYAEQMKELMMPNGDMISFNMINGILKHEDVGERGSSHGKIDTLVKANMESFGQDASTVVGETFIGVSTVVKRR
ncbi:putative outer membrane protein pmp10, partial [Bienertia sinuspersici]